MQIAIVSCILACGCGRIGFGRDDAGVASDAAADA